MLRRRASGARTKPPAGRRKKAEKGLDNPGLFTFCLSAVEVSAALTPVPPERMQLTEIDPLELNRRDEPVQDDQAEVRVLLRGIANGDRLSFAEFHRRFSGMVYATAIQVLHNHEDAQDTSQEVFASLWKKAKMFMDDRGKPSTWLAAMARNRSIDKLRSRQRRSRLNDSFEDESRTEEKLFRLDPAKEASANEIGLHVRTAVMELSPEQREAIQLAFFEGLTQLEIAHKTGEPLGTIKARIRRGLGRLRALVKP